MTSEGVVLSGEKRDRSILVNNWTDRRTPAGLCRMVSIAANKGKLLSTLKCLLGSEHMDGLLKFLSCLMLSALVTVQLLLVSPYRGRLTDDSINGKILETYESVISKGKVVLDAMGNYEPNSAYILINGEKQKLVDAFPVELDLRDGDVVGIQLKIESPTFYVFLLSRKGPIKTDLKGSTIQIKPGINTLFRVTGNNTGR